jgi:hypothetical protein
VPDEVTLDMEEEQHFNLSFYEDIVQITPDSVEYVLDGLDGTLSNDAIDGVDYTAPSSGTEGDIVAAAYYDTGTIIIGAVDISHVTVIDDTVPTDCEIEPSTFEMGPYEYKTYTVTCTNYYGDSIACTGDNWYWVGLSGGFITKTNEYAQAYSTSSVGNSGQLAYESGTAICYSDLTLIEPIYTSDLTPDSVDLNYSESQHFTFEAAVNGIPSTPDSSDYYLVDELVGTLSNEALDGVDYTAPSYDSNGNILAVATFITGDPTLPEGTVDFSYVTVSNGTEDDDNGDGDTDDCSIIASSPMMVERGSTNWIGIACGPDANVVCPSTTDWDISGAATPGAGDGYGTFFTVTGTAGDTGTIVADINGNAIEGGTCSKDFEVYEGDCVDYS